MTTWASFELGNVTADSFHNARQIGPHLRVFRLEKPIAQPHQKGIGPQAVPIQRIGRSRLHLYQHLIFSRGYSYLATPHNDSGPDKPNDTTQPKNSAQRVNCRKNSRQNARRAHNQAQAV
jgi:hypothetical protein